jgi:hypothetical protein
MRVVDLREGHKLAKAGAFDESNFGAVR